MKRFRTVLIYLLLLSLVLAAIATMVVRNPPKTLLTADVAIHGRVLRDGKPLVWKSEAPEKRLLLVWFMPKDRSTDYSVYSADCDTDQGTFRISKIPLGTYHVCIQQNDPHPLGDLLEFAYSPAHSQLYRDVTHDGQEFVIDLPKDLPKSGAGPGKVGQRPKGVPPAPKVPVDPKESSR